MSELRHRNLFTAEGIDQDEHEVREIQELFGNPTVLTEEQAVEVANGWFTRAALFEVQPTFFPDFIRAVHRILPTKTPLEDPHPRIFALLAFFNSALAAKRCLDALLETQMVGEMVLVDQMLDALRELANDFGREPDSDSEKLLIAAAEEYEDRELVKGCHDKKNLFLD
jgi:hypothetical protein